MRVAREASANSGESVVFARAVNCQRDEAKQPGVEGINLGSELGVAAIHRKGVLGEIVRANREEIRFLGKNLGHHSHDRNFRHDAARHGGDPERTGFLSQNRLRVKQFRHRCDHRKHDAQIPELGSAKQSAKLRAEDFRPVKPDADAAFAKEWVVFFRNRQISERLVSPDVKRADNHGTVRAEGKGDGFVFFKLLVFARGRGALHEQKLRAQQADAVAAQLSDLVSVFDAPDIRGDLNMVSIGRRGRLERVGEIFLPLLFVADLRLAQLFHLLCGRIQP